MLTFSEGALGDALQSISCAAGYNLRWLMRAIVRLGIGPIFLRLLRCALLRPLTAPTAIASQTSVRTHWLRNFIAGVRTEKLDSRLLLWVASR